MTQTEIFSNNLNRFLKMRDERQTDFAKALGVSQSAISEWVAGHKMPKMNRVAQICAHFGCEFSDLLGEQNPTDDKHILFLYEQLSAEGKELVVDYIGYVLHRERGNV